LKKIPLIICFSLLALSLGISCQSAQPEPPPQEAPVPTVPKKTQIDTPRNLVKLADSIYRKWGKKAATRKVILVDFSRSRHESRLFVVDLDSNKIIKSTKVCHGIGSGQSDVPTVFSNVSGSKASSLGVMVTAETYQGTWGYSMIVDGLERGLNSNARTRQIVFHCSDKQKAFWSWGCFSIPGRDAKEVIDLTKGGSLIYSFR
jgi:hypothetical protein